MSWLVVVALAFFAACEDGAHTTSGPDAGARANHVSQLQGAQGAVSLADARNPYPPGRDEFALFEVARHTPWLGSVLLENETVVVSVTDATRTEHVLIALRGWLEGYRTSRELTHVDIVTRPARYGFGELSLWMAQATETVLTRSDVHFVDLNEATNRLEIGVAHQAARQSVIDALLNGRIPADAFAVSESGAAAADVGSATMVLQSSGTLGQTFQPIPGGVSVA